MPYLKSILKWMVAAACAFAAVGYLGVQFQTDRSPRSVEIRYFGPDDPPRGLVGDESPAEHPEDQFRDEVALYLSSLQSSEVRFNRLKSVPFGKPETITVVITPPGIETNPVVFLGRNGVIERHAVPLATQIEAELVSLDEDVEIRPQGPLPILLRPDREIDTSWRVTARRTEPFTLQLVLSNRVSIEGRELVDRKPFTRRFEVEVSGWRQALLWIGEFDPVWTVLGGIASIAALVAAAHQAIRFLRRANSEPPELPPPPV